MDTDAAVARIERALEVAEDLDRTIKENRLAMSRMLLADLGHHLCAGLEELKSQSRSESTIDSGAPNGKDPDDHGGVDQDHEPPHDQGR